MTVGHAKTYYYDGIDELPDMHIIWCGHASTVDGIATFAPTKDNLDTGDPLFRIIHAAQATARSSDGIASNIAVASVRDIRSDLRQITVSAIIRGNFYAPDGTRVDLTLFGI